jgi:hypothetical protein
MSKHPLYNQTGLQKENKSHVLYALADKQMELKLIQDEYEAKVSKIRRDLAALETTICLFDENCSETIKALNTKMKRAVKTKREMFFERGELRKLILTILRTSKKPLRTGEMTDMAIESKGLDKKDERIFASIQKSILYQLKNIEASNLIYKSGKDGLNILWEIKD